MSLIFLVCGSPVLQTIDKICKVSRRRQAEDEKRIPKRCGWLINKEFLTGLFSGVLNFGAALLQRPFDNKFFHAL